MEVRNETPSKLWLPVISELRIEHIRFWMIGEAFLREAQVADPRHHILTIQPLANPPSPNLHMAVAHPYTAPPGDDGIAGAIFHIFAPMRRRVNATRPFSVGGVDIVWV